MTRRYSLVNGARVIPRTPDVLQIGTDPPRCVLVHEAPLGSMDILTSLDGVRTLGQVLTEHDADPLVWHHLVEQLLTAELLTPVDRQLEDSQSISGAHLLDERSGLVHRHGLAAAARIMQARDDALVVVRGSSLVATSIATVLAAAGVGHVVPEPGPARHTATVHGAARRQPADQDAPRRTPARVDTSAPLTAAAQSLSAAQGVLAGVLRELYPTVRVHPPAAHQPPTMVVMVGGQMPDLGLAASYTRGRIPHLAVTAGVARAVVGPLVIPGRSSCLSCAHRHRTDADPGWPSIARQVVAGDSRTSAFLVTAAASLAVGQVLDHIDGVTVPSAVNGTLEWRSGDLAPRRRSWVSHPDCGCRGEV